MMDRQKTYRAGRRPRLNPTPVDSRHMFEGPESTPLSGLKIIKLESRVCTQQDLSGAGLGASESDNKGRQGTAGTGTDLAQDSRHTMRAP